MARAEPKVLVWSELKVGKLTFREAFAEKKSNTMKNGTHAHMYTYASTMNL